MSQKLHQLIQSLSKSEKRYFKLYAQRFSDKEGSLKMVIFDNISKQDSYNEELLYKKLAPKLTKNRYAVEKVHLYQMILDSLRAYHANSFMEVELLQALQTIRILWIKGLSSAAQQMIDKYKKLLYEEFGGDSVYLLNFISFEKLMVYSVVPRPQQQAHIQQLLTEYDATLKMLDETNEMSSLIAKSNYLRNEKYCPRNPKLKNECFKFLMHPILQEEMEHLRLTNVHKSLRIRFHIANMLKDYDNMWLLINRVIEALPPILKGQETALNNYCLNLVSKMEAALYVELPNKDRLIETLAAEIQAIPEEYGSREKIVMTVYLSIFESYTTTLKYWIIKKNLSKIKTASLELLAQLERMPDIVAYAKSESTNQDLYFEIYHNLAKAYFMLGDYGKALDYNHHILDLGDRHFMAWDYRKAFLFSLLIHFELQNYQLLPYQIDKLEHFLKKIEAPFMLENQLCKFLKRIIAFPSGHAEQLALFGLLHRKITPLLEDPFEQFEQFDFDYWAWVKALAQ